MVRCFAVVGVVAAGLLVQTRTADACSPPYDPSDHGPTCSFLKLWTPAQSFPRDLSGSLRVGTFDRTPGNVLSQQPTFDPTAELLVHREIAGGYQEVAFSLVQQPGLVSNALQLLLADPIPGRYVVSSAYGTCVAEPSPTGNGGYVGEFELEPSVAFPASLGTVTWLGEESETRTLDVDDGNCGTIEVTTRTAHSTFELELANDALPWDDVIDASLHVDGKLHYGYSRLQVGGGIATFDLSRVCSSSDQDAIKPEPGFGPGAHTFKVVATIEHLTVIESNEVMFTLSCGTGDGDDASGEGWASGGCTTTPTSGCAWLIGAAFVLVRRRRHARA